MEAKVSRPVRFSFCLSSYLYNSIQTYRNKNLIIDTRDPQYYHRHHFTPSIHISSQRLQAALNVDPDLPNLDSLKASDISDLLNDAEKVMFGQRKRSLCFIVMCESSLPNDLIQILESIAGMKELDDFCEIDEREIMDRLKERAGSISEMCSVSLAMEIYKLLRRDKVSEVHILLDSVSQFLTSYPHMNHILGSNLVCPNGSSLTPPAGVQKVEELGSFPHDILEGRIFLGSFKHAQTYDTIKLLSVSHILNVTMECENIFEDKGISYLKTGVLDEADKEINRLFERCFLFIENALNENTSNRVLIHCAMGKSRSATMVIMFLMKKYNWNFERAYNFVKNRRHIIDPNDGFRRQLIEFEQSGFIFMNPELPITIENVNDDQGKVIG